MKPFLKAVTLSSLFTILTSCSGDPLVQPAEPPGRRDYVWTVDTLQMGGNYPTLNRIWGSSPEDVYVIGEGLPSSNNIWHYDGKFWKPSNEGGFYGLYGLYGFAKNDIWLSSHDNIQHYNGATWVKNTKLQIDGFRVVVENLWGISSKEMYAATLTEKNDYTRTFGALFKYDGNSWTRTTTVDYENMFFANVRIDNIGTILIHAIGVHNDLEKILIWNGERFNEILSTYDGSSLINIGDKVFFSNGAKVYSFMNGDFKLWQDFTGTEFKSLLGARNERDVFAISKSGIGHFNGKDFETIYKTDYDVSFAAIFEKDIFVITLEGFNTKPVIIIHGKLK